MENVGIAVVMLAVIFGAYATVSYIREKLRLKKEKERLEEIRRQEAFKNSTALYNKQRAALKSIGVGGAKYNSKRVEDAPRVHSSESYQPSISFGSSVPTPASPSYVGGGGSFDGGGASSGWDSGGSSGGSDSGGGSSSTD